MSRAITARVTIGDEAVAKITYETNEKSEYGKRLARLVLDEYVGFVDIISEDEDDRWEVRFTDGDSEISFINTSDEEELLVDVDGEFVDAINYTASDRASVMWKWMAQEGWY